MKTPVEIDTEIARLSMEKIPHEQTVSRQLHYFSSEDAYVRSRYDGDKREAAQLAIAHLNEEISELEAQYTGWSRYFHVTNNNGHIHTSICCSSCFHDTEFAWRTDLSGLTPEQVVEREAYNACSICMPIAPAEQKAARQRYNKEQRDAKAAERQAKKDAKAERALARARKLAEKVEKTINDLGGMETFTNDYSLYGHDGRKSVYALDVPTSVGDALYTLKETQESNRPLNQFSDSMTQALTEKGLI